MSRALALIVAVVFAGVARAEPPVSGFYEVVSVHPVEGPPTILAEAIKQANPHIYWVRIVWEFAGQRCSVKGHFLGHDDVFGDHACDVEVDFDPRWEGDTVIVPMSVAARSHFRTLTRRDEGGEDVVDTDKRSCNVSIPSGTFRAELKEDDSVHLVNQDSGEVLRLVPTEPIPSYIYRLPER